MIDAIRNIEKALGNGIKKPSKSELKNKDIARKSIVAKREIKKGEIFTEDNITVKRPGNGISPMRWYEVLGKVASRDYKEDELIEL
jgi:N,N'-diacetyllegionaminate synthase